MQSIHSGYDLKTRVFGGPTDFYADITVSLNGKIVWFEDGMIFHNQTQEQAELSAVSFARIYADKHANGEIQSPASFVK